MPKGHDRISKKAGITGKKTVHRSSETGQFVEKSYADKNPRTTERERVRTSPPKKKK